MPPTNREFLIQEKYKEILRKIQTLLPIIIKSNREEDSSLKNNDNHAFHYNISSSKEYFRKYISESKYNVKDTQQSYKPKTQYLQPSHTYHNISCAKYRVFSARFRKLEIQKKYLSLELYSARI